MKSLDIYRAKLLSPFLALSLALGVSACGNQVPEHTVKIEGKTFYNYGANYIEIDGIRYPIYDNSPTIEYLGDTFHGDQDRRRYRCVGNQLDIVTIDDDSRITGNNELSMERLNFVCNDNKIVPGELTYPEGTKIDTSDLPS